MNNKASPWSPLKDPNEIKLIGKTLEELGELTQALSRSLIQGIDEEMPDSKKTNKVWVEEEIADSLAMIYILMAAFELNNDKMSDRARKKISFFNSWDIPNE